MSKSLVVIKKMIPKPIKKRISRSITQKWTASLFDNDKERFINSYAKEETQTEEQLKGRIILYSHAIEKGLSRESIRFGFGKEVIKSLAEKLEIYMEENYNPNDSVYVNGLSVMRAYIELHKKEKFDIEEFTNKYPKVIQAALDNKSTIGGEKVVDNSTKQQNQDLNFEQLAKSRMSIRDYADTDVDIKKVNHAIKIATKSPSVCNRQSSRVYVIRDKETIEEALKLQGGFKGYEMPPVLIMVTTDNSYFVSVLERNQGYTDGGIFSMSLLYGLEFVGLAACALNTMFDLETARKTKSLLGIPDSENLIMYISVGNFKKENKIPKSFRYDVDEITTYI